MLFADYGESYAGPRVPAYSKVDPLSHRMPNGMLVYQRGHGLMAPSLPPQFAPVHIASTEATRSPSATTPAGTVVRISTPSTTLPRQYQQSITISAPKQLPPMTTQSAPRPSTGGGVISPSSGSVRPPTGIPAPGFTTRPTPRPVSVKPPAGGQLPSPAPVPPLVTTGGGGGGGSSPLPRPAAQPDTITFPEDVLTKVGQALSPAPKSRTMWFVLGGLGLVALAGGAYYVSRDR